MKARIHIVEKAIDTGLLTVLFLATGIYASLAQGQFPAGSRDNKQSTGLSHGAKSVDVRVPDPLQSDDLVFASKAQEGEIVVTSQLAFSSKAMPLNSYINTPYSEFKPAVSPDGKRLYFSRAFSPENTGRTKDAEDIWYTEYNPAEDSWTQSIRLPGVLNTAGPTSINLVGTSGDTVIYSSTYKKMKKFVPVTSYSVSLDGVWSNPVPIPVPNSYNELPSTETFVSLKTGVIVTSVKRNDSFGERDLYVSFWDGERASEPINMSHVLNTDKDESSPFLSSDLKTLYFASKGHAGFGGYDIYSSTRLDDSWTNWTQPENLGSEINSALDEEFFMITTGQKFAFFARQISDKNYDIFRISLESHQVRADFR